MTDATHRQIMGDTHTELEGDLSNWITTKKSGGRLNKKDGLTRYGDSHVKDKTS